MLEETSKAITLAVKTGASVRAIRDFMSCTALNLPRLESSVGDAPFVGGFAGFARVFVTASFACKSVAQAVLLLSLIILEQTVAPNLSL